MGRLLQSIMEDARPESADPAQSKPESPIDGGNGEGVALNSTAEKSQCDQEFDWYESERPELRRAEFDTEKNYDTLLATAAGLFLGFGLTTLKDFASIANAIWLPVLMLACLCFTASLFLALYDKKLTYESHKAWRELIDLKFLKWKPGAREAALAEYDSLPGIRLIPRIKLWAWWLLVVGIGLLLLVVFVNVLVRVYAAPINAPQPSASSTAVPGSPATGAVTGSSATGTPARPADQAGSSSPQTVVIVNMPPGPVVDVRPSAVPAATSRPTTRP
jgi:hypothetical protein